nr:sn1-specific diacylglycerol lipase beta isoform X2 [Ipomoea batatas]
MRTNDRRETDNDAINSDFWKQDLNAKPQIQSNRIPMLHVSGQPPLYTLHPIGGRPHGPPSSPPATFVPSGRAEHRGKEEMPEIDGYGGLGKLCEEPLPVPEERIHEAALFIRLLKLPILVCYLMLEEIQYFFHCHGYVGKAFSLLGLKKDKCKTAYFIVVLHHLKTVVIAVRGTETPEDLITDGLCRECSLSEGDGLVKHFQLQLGDHNLGWCKEAYFIVLLHHFKTDVIVVCGTETLEDLIADGLCREYAAFLKGILMALMKFQQRQQPWMGINIDSVDPLTFALWMTHFVRSLEQVQRTFSLHLKGAFINTPAHARWCSKVRLLALPVRAGNMGVVLHSLCWIVAKALSFSTIDKSRLKSEGRTRN